MLVDTVQTLVTQLLLVNLIVLVVLFTRLEDATVELLLLLSSPSLIIRIRILDFSHSQEAAAR